MFNRVDDRGVEVIPHMRDFRFGKIKGMMRYKQNTYAVRY